jgi:tight adherence protein B
MRGVGMTRILSLFAGISFFGFLWLLFSVYLGKDRAIKRLQAFEAVPLKQKADAHARRQEKKLAVRFFAKGLRKTGLFKEYLVEKRRFLAKAHLHVTVEEYLAIKLLAILFFWMVLAWVSPHFILLFIMGLLFGIVGWVIPDSYVEHLIEKRKNRLNRQLCDALKIISNSLRAGHGFFQAVASMVSEVEGPVAEEFSRLLQEIKLGVSVEAALENMTDRVDSEDLRFVATAVIIQRESGGNLSEILDNISQTIKGRITLQRELLAASAQGKISALILALIPVAITLYVLLVNRQTHGILIKEPIGWAMLAVAMGMELLGIYFIRRILKIKF